MLGRAVFNQTTQSWSIERLAGSAGSGIPVGSVIEIVGSIVPPGYLACDGTTFSAATYPTLYTILNSTTLPDYRSLAQQGNTIVIRALTGAQDLDDTTITAYIVNLLETSYVPKDIALQDRQIVIYDATTNTWKGVDLPVMNNRALVSVITDAHTETHQAFTDGTNYYDINLSQVSEPAGTVSTTQNIAGTVYVYNDDFYYHNPGDSNWYNVIGFQEVSSTWILKLDSTAISDQTLIDALDACTDTVTFTLKTYIESVPASTSYGWGSSGGNGISYIGTTAGYEVAKLIPDGQDGFIPSGSLVDLTDKTNPLMMTGATYTRSYYVSPLWNLGTYYEITNKYENVEYNTTSTQSLPADYLWKYYSADATLGSDGQIWIVDNAAAGTGFVATAIRIYGIEADTVSQAIPGFTPGSGNKGLGIYFKNNYSN